MVGIYFNRGKLQNNRKKTQSTHWSMKLWPQNSKLNKNFIFGRLFYIFLVYRFWYYCVRVSRLKKQQQVNTFLYSKLLTLTHFDNNNCFTVRNRA